MSDESPAQEPSPHLTEASHPDVAVGQGPDPEDVLAGDVSFAATLDPEVRSFGRTTPQVLVCEWCNEPLPAPGLEHCPHCDALLKPADESLQVPGVTTLSPEAARVLELAEVRRQREAARRGETLVAAPATGSLIPAVPAPAPAEIEAALRPPDEEVRRLMREMEEEARRAASAREAALPAEAEAPQDPAAREGPEPPA